MFKHTFEVVEVHASGARITHYLRGTKKQIKKDVNMYKKHCKDYQMVGKNAMIMWVY